MDKITGVLLAGGRSTRMQKDKRVLNYRDRSFVQTAVENLKAVAGQVLIISDEEFSFPGTQWYSDLLPDSGPLAGIHTGMVQSVYPNVLILPVDMPLMEPHVLAEMIRQSDENYDALIPVIGDKWQQLSAIYRTNLKTTLEEKIHSGTRKVFDFVRSLKVKTWVVPPELHIYFKNINTLDEYNSLDKLP